MKTCDVEGEESLVLSQPRRQKTMPTLPRQKRHLQLPANTFQPAIVHALTELEEQPLHHAQDTENRILPSGTAEVGRFSECDTSS